MRTPFTHALAIAGAAGTLAAAVSLAGLAGCGSTSPGAAHSPAPATAAPSATSPAPWAATPKPTAAPASAASPVRPVTAYVANSGNGGQGTVTPINTLTGKAGRPIKAGTGPEDIAITPDGKTAYVSCAGSTPPIVVPIRTATNTAGQWAASGSCVNRSGVEGCQVLLLDVDLVAGQPLGAGTGYGDGPGLR